MKPITGLMILAVLLTMGFGYYQFSVRKQGGGDTKISLPAATPAPIARETVSPTPYPDTKMAIQSFLANKYKKPLSEVNVTIAKEVPGYAAGSVLFGQGGPGEGGMWLAVLGNGWDVVWDGNGNVDCNKMRQVYGIPDTILKPNFCD